jgi:phage terminase large subunit
MRNYLRKRSASSAVVRIPNQWQPRWYQEPIMRYFDNGGRRAVWVVHRRGGKDNTMLNQVAKMGQRRIGAYWHMFPTHRQARKAIWDGIDKTTGKRYIDQAFPEAVRESTNNTEMKIIFRNGSLFQLLGSDNYDSNVGANPVHVTFSEWSLCKAAAYDFVRPILVENDGTAAFIYTPRGNNHGKKLKEMAEQNPKWFCQVMPLDYTNAYSMELVEEERRAGMPEELIRQEYFCDFNVGVAGAYYAYLIDKMRAALQLEAFAIHPEDVYTHWDIGFTDSCAIIFWKFRYDGAIDIIDCYEAHGLPVEHYVRVIHKKGYKYAGHFLPHDANDSRYKFATNLTIKEQLREALPNVHITPKLQVQDGIQAVRIVLSPKANTRIHGKNCEELIAALEHHHREYDEETRIFKSSEAETWAIHYADAMRYMAVCTQLLRDKFFAKPLSTGRVVKTIDELVMDDFVAAHTTGDRL